MMNQCFIQQPVTGKILEFVTSVCSECYKSLSEGEEVFYDTEQYRYICKECADRICEELIEKERALLLEDEEIDDTPSLF